VIGTMMAPILESVDPVAAREHARQLGLAFQLTNFLRDVAEGTSSAAGVYLPRRTWTASA
jgi:15-cis-phytoene synthase